MSVLKGPFRLSHDSDGKNVQTGDVEHNKCIAADEAAIEHKSFLTCKDECGESDELSTSSLSDCRLQNDEALCNIDDDTTGDCLTWSSANNVGSGTTELLDIVQGTSRVSGQDTRKSRVAGSGFRSTRSSNTLTRDVFNNVSLAIDVIVADEQYSRDSTTSAPSSSNKPTVLSSLEMIVPEGKISGDYPFRSDKNIPQIHKDTISSELMSSQCSPADHPNLPLCITTENKNINLLQDPNSLTTTLAPAFPDISRSVAPSRILSRCLHNEIQATVPQQFVINRQQKPTPDFPLLAAQEAVDTRRPKASVPLMSQDQSSSFRKFPRDLKVLCRLIAAHQKTPATGSVVSFFVDGQTHRFRVRLNIDIGQNVRCLVFERSLGTDRIAVGINCEIDVPINSSDMIIAFNWFSPQGIWDYISLGTKLLINPGNIEKDYCMCSEVSMAHALQFFHHPQMRDLLYELKLGHVPHGMSPAQKEQIRMSSSAAVREDKFKTHHILPSRTDLETSMGLHRNLSHVKKITLTGFSMGGSTAHAFALLLKETKKMPQDIRCVGFGSPRPGNDRLSRWVAESLTPDSLNIILGSEEYHDNNNQPVDVGFNGNEVNLDPLLPLSSCDRTAPALQNDNNISRACLDNMGQACDNNILSCSADINTAHPTSGPVIMYDPVTRTPSCATGFDVHPNLHVILQQKCGILRPLSVLEKERLRHEDFMQGNNTPPPSTLSAIVNIAFRGSPFPPDVSRGIDKLHSVLRYYEAMCGVE